MSVLASPEIEIADGFISTIRCVITTKWDSGYRPITISSVESFFIDSALDTDADSWTVEIGDPTFELIDLLHPDSEVRVQLFQVGRGVDYLNTGFVDEISYTENGIITMSGRDISAVATDSMAIPGEFRHVRAHELVAQRARALKIANKLNLAQTKTYKRQYTDGSETEWEFWYRLYRKEQMWIWAGPEGSLNAGFLKYDAEPTYYFYEGVPDSEDFPKGSANIVRIPITAFEINKSTQGRVGWVWAFGETRSLQFFDYTGEDKTTREWIKRPLRIISPKESHNRNAVRREMFDELHDSRIGALEIRLTTVDPGWPIRQNTMARLQFEAGEIVDDNEFFVVGTRMVGNAQGLTQEVRLRQKDFALTVRVPPDPKPPEKVTHEEQLQVSTDLSGANVFPAHPEWGDYFVRAANEFQGGWGFQLYLAVLLAMCDKETGFHNIRELGGPGADRVEWRPPPDAGTESPGGPSRDHGAYSEKLENWKTIFANSPGGGYVSREFGVGPMQLTFPGYKTMADDYMRRGYHDQWQGGRWHPEHNIRTAAKALSNALSGVPQTNKNNIYIGVGRYNGGANYASKSISLAYVGYVRDKVENKYLPGIQSSIDTAKTTTKGKVFPLGAGVHVSYFGSPADHANRKIGNWFSDNAADIMSTANAPAVVIEDGTLGSITRRASNGRGVEDGSTVFLLGDSGDEWCYMHLNPPPVWARQGIRVKAGTLLGTLGPITRGGPHLHLGRKSGNPHDAASYPKVSPKAR